MKLKNQLRAAVAVLALGSAVVSQADVTELDNQRLQRMIEQGALVIDVRRADEWQATGVLEGSHPITFFDARGRYDVQDWLRQLEGVSDSDERQQNVVLICAHGVRSKKIADLLDKRLGYTRVHNVSNGIADWLKAGLPATAWKP